MHTFLDQDDIDHCLKFSALDALQEVADFGTIVHSTIAIICMALICNAVPYGVQHTYPNPTLFSPHHSERFVAFFLLL